MSNNAEWLNTSIWQSYTDCNLNSFVMYYLNFYIKEGRIFYNTILDYSYKFISVN